MQDAASIGLTFPCTKIQRHRGYKIDKATWYNNNQVVYNISRLKFWITRDFPGGTVVKNPPGNAGDTGSSPGPGRSHMPRSN